MFVISGGNCHQVGEVRPQEDQHRKETNEKLFYDHCEIGGEETKTELEEWPNVPKWISDQKHELILLETKKKINTE